MSPILAAATGVTFNELGPSLNGLLEELNNCNDIPSLILTLERSCETSPFFEEQIDLHQWVGPLNAMDEIIRNYLSSYPLLLLPPIKSPRRSPDNCHRRQRCSATVDSEIPTNVWHHICIILRFWELMLRHAIAKSIFSSVDECVDLLAASDDVIADAALVVLQALALPPALHRQQAPDVANNTALQQPSAAHARLTILARGYGSRVSGLGLYHLVATDDSVYNQLPPVGQVQFSYYSNLHGMIEIQLTEEEILFDGSSGVAKSSGNTVNGSNHGEKRRRVGQQRECRSTSDLFFCALEKIQQETIKVTDASAIHKNIDGDDADEDSSDRLFRLIADIRMARNFYSRDGRLIAVERRLRALVCILHTHPSQEIISGYFQAQPELCVELIDLLRPTVSSAHVTSTSSNKDQTVSGGRYTQSPNWNSDGISGLADSNPIPYGLRVLAVEALTALVSRRDASTGALSGSLRLSTVLMELGVSKGYYLGLLPTLIRYSLASLGAAANEEDDFKSVDFGTQDQYAPTEITPMDLGLAFVQATMAPQPPRNIQVLQALNFIDSVLTLTSAVVASPSGTSALTDCGLIPALLATVAADTNQLYRRLINTAPHVDEHRIKALIRFITAQAVQILEGAVVTHSHALTAFHDLQGVQVLTNRLIKEVDVSDSLIHLPPTPLPQDAMDESAVGIAKSTGLGNKICSSQRVLLFSIITCLTVVFHQETSASSPTSGGTPPGGSQLRRKDLTDTLIFVLDNVASYGGHLASLIATLLSDVMNGDPHIVHYVHQSGIAKAFMNMIMGEQVNGSDQHEPVLPPVPELIMAIPNVLAAFSLTEDGAEFVHMLNPFPSLLRIFYHPSFAMPRSRCLLNEMTAIVGTGLDEIMRHVERLKPLVINALVNGMKEVVSIAKELSLREFDFFGFLGPLESEKCIIEAERTCLIQYVLNFGQLLEQILHNEDHCEPFVEAGGLEVFFQLYTTSMTSGFQFLSHISCLSSPSVSTLHHSTIEESLALVFKCIQFRYSHQKLLQRLTEVTSKCLDNVEESQSDLFGKLQHLPFALDNLPLEPLYKLVSEDSADKVRALSSYLRNVAILHWHTGQLASSVKAIVQLSLESGNDINQMHFTTKIIDLLDRLSSFFQASLIEVCRVRTEEYFEQTERERLLLKPKNLRFRVRIVCPEGAVVRDGIEIDSCTNVGSMEMGEIDDSFDRCINSSGILRYRTSRGWVSEMTRGHGREPIAEVISVYESDDDPMEIDKIDKKHLSRVEAALPGLRIVAVGVLARGQTCYSELFCALSKLSVQFIRSVTVTNGDFTKCLAGESVASIIQVLSRNAESAFNHSDVLKSISFDHSPGASRISLSGVALYFSCLISHCQGCLFDDKRERRLFNLPLLISLVSSDPCAIQLYQNTIEPYSGLEMTKLRPMGLFGACVFIFKEGFRDLQEHSLTMLEKSLDKIPRQRVSRSVAASFPPLLTFLRRLVSTPVATSPAASIMSRIKWKDVSVLLGKKNMDFSFINLPEDVLFFEPERFVKSLHVIISKAVKECWSDVRLASTPPHLLNPIISLVSDIIIALEDATKKKSKVSSSSLSSTNENGYNLSDYFRHRRRRSQENESSDAEYEVDWSVVTQLAEMGFHRDHALDAMQSLRSNRVEIAMEYCLTHPPPSPETVTQRRIEREERQRRREESQTSTSGQGNRNVLNETETNLTSGDTGSSDVLAADEHPSSSSIVNKSDKIKQVDEPDFVRAKEELSSWIVTVPKVCSRLLETFNTCSPGQKSVIKVDENGDGEIEATTVVLCSLLLDLCHRYPQKRTDIIFHVIDSLKNQLDIQESKHDLLNQTDKNLAALYHAVVLITRALPKTRLLILKSGIATATVSNIQNNLCGTQSDTIKQTSWPPWLAPSLLLLDAMAQPVVAFSHDKNFSTDDSSGQSNDIEFLNVLSEHKLQAEKIADMAHRLFAAETFGEAQSPAGCRDNKDKEDDKPVSTHKKFSEASFESIPAFFPLLPINLADVCLDICLKLLGAHTNFNVGSPPPGIAHASLLLLLRLLRSPQVSTKCQSSGVAETILALPASSKFTGNTGLVALIFRRLLEDESTLQSAMETELRGIMTKLQGKKSSSLRDDKVPITLHAFVEAVTPLLCRDPISFMKAMACTVKVEPRANASLDPTVTLLTSYERGQQILLLAENNLQTSSNDDPAFSNDCQQNKISITPKLKGKSFHKSTKKCTSTKKNKREKISSQKGSILPLATAESFAAHICNLLLVSIMTSVAADEVIDYSQISGSKQFLWVGNRLEILSDLILAVPACACAVHNFRLHRNKDKTLRAAFNGQLSHALSGCPAPTKSFVNFILHSLLPQDRWSPRNDSDIWDRRKGESEKEIQRLKQKRECIYQITAASQAAARLILALVARPGEGRKRVISDLTFALSGGRIGHGPLNIDDKGREALTVLNARELFAIQAWGEICVAIVAPRSTGRNIEDLCTLSVENVRIMLDQGMVHALLYAINRINLLHPMAPSTCGEILTSLECLTRPAVGDAVKQHVDKECNKEAHEAHKSCSDNEVSNMYLSEQFDHGRESIAVDERIEFEFIVDAEQNVMDETEGVAVDVEMDGMHRDRSDDDGISRDEESDDTNSDEDSASDVDDGDSEDEDDDSSTLDDSDEIQSDEVEEEGDWNIGNDDALAADNSEDQQVYEEWDEDGTERVEQAVDEGWTRIESSGFGGMLLGGRRNMLAGVNSERTPRTRGFIGAAEAMIGSLLRNGEISSETLAEIEGSLGIRIMGNSRSPQSTSAVERTGTTAVGSSLAVRILGAEGSQPELGRRSEVIGTLPHVHQRGQPDLGYSAFGNGGRWAEVSSMEFVFGGPSLTAGSRNYDLISPMDDSSEDHVQPHITQLDLQLYPGGPSAAATARTHHSLHPLLCGIDLPPVNALVSDLLPHGVRATRHGQMTTRRPGDWTSATLPPGGYLVSTSNGNIVRSNRSHSGTPLGGGLTARHVAGPVGWTDDGLPVDATVEQFSSAIESAFAAASRRQQNILPSTDRERVNLSGALQQFITTPGDAAVSQSAATNPLLESHEAAGHSTNEHRASEPFQPSLPSDGDRVATSLAAGLRLSPGSEPGSGSNDMSSDIIAEEENPNENHTTDTHACMTTSNLEGTRLIDSVSREGSTDANLSAIENLAHREGNNESQDQNSGTLNDELVCPPDVDLEVFCSLPIEMQRDCVNQYNATRELADQLDGSTLDAEVLAALPEDMRLEVIEQDRRERELRVQSQAQADPSNAEEMDNASFVASLSPELREEILLTADEAFLNSLPPSIVAEAQIVRERASQQRRHYEDALLSDENHAETGAGSSNQSRGQLVPNSADSGSSSANRKKLKLGKIRVQSDRQQVTYVPKLLPNPVAVCDLMSLIRLMYLLSPVRPSSRLQKVFQNFFSISNLRTTITATFVQLLRGDGEHARTTVRNFMKHYESSDHWRKAMDSFFGIEEFPPFGLLGAASDMLDSDLSSFSVSSSLLRTKQDAGTMTALSANLPQRAKSSHECTTPPVVASRIIETLLQLCKSSSRFCLHMLVSPAIELNSTEESHTCFDELLDLLENPIFSNSSTNLDQLLTLLESAVSPLTQISKLGDEELEIKSKDIESAATGGKEWVDVPRVTVSQSRLQVLCSILRMESCRETSFTKVNNIVRRLCRVESNRGFVLSELASVAHGLGADAIRDLRASKLRMDSAARLHKKLLTKRVAKPESPDDGVVAIQESGPINHLSSSVTLSTSSSELKLLRVLQTLQALCGENWEESNLKKTESSVIVTEELVHLLRQLEFGELWDELSSCLKVVQLLEGVKALENDDRKASEEMDTNDDVSGDGNLDNGKKLRNSAAGLLSRFLPSIEAFFVANASAIRPKDRREGESLSGRLDDIPLENLAGGDRLLTFVGTNKVLLNALIRNNSNLLDRGFRALVQIPRCRIFLDFDVKRQWFKTQMRRLRQQASRRHGSLRLHIRRKYVFEDAYHQLRLRNSDEMRGRLHITFRNEEGVDAGGLSREFFGILAKEIFNPNYALFTSTEDGCTFQPNPNSSINPDHLSYFRFVGRIVGKAVADGFLLDAHFTRSLYKHMLGLKPTHHDMEAIDPDYYRNLKTILEYNLADIGLDLSFSIEDHSFGRSQTIDLIPNGRSVNVTEENKEEYVRLVCQHRMTSAIQSQIKAYLDGFYELVSPDLIAIFTPRELELLISGLPEIDLYDLKKHTDYVGWKATDKEIEWFWNVLFSLGRNEKASFLQFVTGSSKVPLAGFAELQGMRGTQKFSIHKASGKTGALMSAHTCFNSLDLPNYGSQEEMREKLLYAINEGGGVFLFA